MRNIKTHSKTMKKKLNKCKTIFYAYNELQFKYGNFLDEKDNVSEFKCNVRINCSLGDNYTTDFYIINKDGSITIRECVYREKLNKPLTAKMLDSSRNYWLSKGIKNWGIVINEEE